MGTLGNNNGFRYHLLELIISIPSSWNVSFQTTIGPEITERHWFARTLQDAGTTLSYRTSDQKYWIIEEKSLQHYPSTTAENLGMESGEPSEQAEGASFPFVAWTLNMCKGPMYAATRSARPPHLKRASWPHLIRIDAIATTILLIHYSLTI